MSTLPLDPEAPDLPPSPHSSELEAVARVSLETSPAAFSRRDAFAAPTVEDAALLALLNRLEIEGYSFTPPTPATHARVVARPERPGPKTLQDVFGWSRAFEPGSLDPDIERLLKDAGQLDTQADGRLKSRVRVARVGDKLFLHSAYPTEAEDSVFLGPDTYRFVDFVVAELAGVASVDRIVDIGAGAGVGGITAGLRRPAAKVVLSDINPAALRLARVNARHAGVEVETTCCGGFGDIDGPLDLVLANPPFLVDPSQRTYRDGGDMHGARLSLDWAVEAAGRLRPGGRMLLYTGVAILDGRDPLREALEAALPSLKCELRYRELDPDIFGEELDTPAYADADRIAAIGAVVVRSG